MKLCLYALPLALLLPGCQGQVARTEAACIANYAVKAPSEKSARWAYQLCHQAFAPETPPEQQKFIRCALPQIGGAGSELGAKIAIQACRK